MIVKGHISGSNAYVEYCLQPSASIIYSGADLGGGAPGAPPPRSEP